MNLLDKILIALGVKEKPKPPKQKSKPQAPAAQPVAPPAPPAPPPPAFATPPGAIRYLDHVWDSKGNKVTVIKQGTVLWHSGIVGPNIPPDNARGLWTSLRKQQADGYNSWAQDHAAEKNTLPYQTEFVTNKDLRVADFERYSLGPFAAGFCQSQHDYMKIAIIEWLSKKHQLDGIIALNGGPDEVVVRLPADDLLIVSQTQI